MDMTEEEMKLFGRLETAIHGMINRFGSLAELELFQKYTDCFSTLQQQNKQMKEELESTINNWNDGANEKVILFTLNAFLQSIQGGSDNES